MVDTTQWINTQQKLNNWKSKLIEKRGARDQLLKIKHSEDQKLFTHLEQQKIHHKAQLFLLSEITERRQDAIESIEKMGTFALRMIYGDGYRLLFNTFEEKRKEGVPNFKMEINIASPCDGEELITGLKDERGGGVQEIVAFALRIAALNWMHYNGPMVLDEAYKSMSNDDKLYSVANFLKEVADSTNRQIIFATHRAEVFAPISDRVIKIINVDGVARIEIYNPSDFEVEE